MPHKQVLFRSEARGDEAAAAQADDRRNTATLRGFLDLEGYERSKIEAAIAIPDRAEPVHRRLGDHFP